MSRVRFFGFEVGNDNIAVAAVGHFHGRSCGPNALATVGYLIAGDLAPVLLPTQNSEEPQAGAVGGATRLRRSPKLTHTKNRICR